MKILVLADPDRRNRLRYLLSPYGYQVLTAQTWKTAWHVFCRSQPRLILVDFHPEPLKDEGWLQKMLEHGLQPRAIVVCLAASNGLPKHDNLHRLASDAPVEKLLLTIKELAQGSPS